MDGASGLQLCSKEPAGRIRVSEGGLLVLSILDGRFPLQRVRFTYERFDGARSAELTWELM